MSSFSINRAVDIRFSEPEGEHLVQAYRILEELANQMWDQNLHKSEEYFQVESARDELETVLLHAGIEL